MKQGDMCCLYWIRRENHTDVFSEGYVGITQNFEYRLSQHINNATNPKQWKNYRTEFRKSLEARNFVASKLLIGSREYCLALEAKLRPDWKIGWNLSKGGSGGFGTHGLTGTRYRSIYYNMLTYARLREMPIAEEWLGEEGLQNFYDFYKAGEEGGKQLAYSLCKNIIGPDTLVFTERAVSELAKKYEPFEDGRMFSLKELGEIFSMRPNTILYRMRRGYTLRQACNLESPPQKQHKTKAKDGRRKRNVEDYKVTDFNGNLFEVAVHSKLNKEQYAIIKQMLIDGETRAKIAQTLCVSASTITNACRRLKWKG